jgi:hypothetical protein
MMVMAKVMAIQNGLSASHLEKKKEKNKNRLKVKVY